MPRRSLLLAPLVLSLLTVTMLPAQRRGRGGSSGLPGAEGSDLIVHGAVTLPDGVIPTRLVAVERNCDGRTSGGVFADSKGHFSFDLGMIDRATGRSAGDFSNVGDARTCSIRVTLAGYHSQTVQLGPLIKSGKDNVGTLTMRPLGQRESVIFSKTDENVPKNARRDYEAAIDDAAKSKWPEALAALEKATGAYPKFANGWLSLGMLQAARNQPAAAIHSYAQAVAADDQFAPAYVELAAAQVVAGDWSKAVEAAGKAIALDPDAFPRAYYIAAMANVRMTDADAAEKSARQGLRADTDHEFPDLEYIEGILLFAKGDVAGGRKQMEDYLSLAPAGLNAANAREQLATTTKPN